MRKSILRAFVIALLLHVGQCFELPTYVQENSNVFTWELFHERPSAVTSNHSLTEGSEKAPCIPPKLCYQVMSVQKIALIQGLINAGSAAATFNPQDKSLSPVAISFLLKNGTSPQLPSKVRLLKEYLIPPHTGQDRLLLFTHEIDSVKTVGAIVGPDGKWNQSALKLFTYFPNTPDSHIVYISGRIETQPIWVKIQFLLRKPVTMVLIPVPKLNDPPSPPVWIDWKNHSVNETHSDTSGSTPSRKTARI